jgi:hypothetical protein
LHSIGEGKDHFYDQFSALFLTSTDNPGKIECLGSVVTTDEMTFLDRQTHFLRICGYISGKQREMMSDWVSFVHPRLEGIS